MAATNKVEISLFFISNFSLLFSFYVSLHCGDRNPAQIIYSSMLQNALRLGLLTVASPLHTALLHTHIWYGTDIRLAYSTDLERHPLIRYDGFFLQFPDPESELRKAGSVYTDGSDGYSAHRKERSPSFFQDTLVQFYQKYAEQSTSHVQ